MDVRDKAGKRYWDEWWSNKEHPPQRFDPFSPRRRDWVNMRFHRYFIRALEGIATEGKSFLEIGCGASFWLPYFAKQFGFEVTGIDYSNVGCAQAEKTLEREGVKGRIVQTDMFAPPEDLEESFDLVFSWGVIEHFEDTVGCLGAVAGFLKPGGLALTVIPNMAGLMGRLQRIVNEAVYLTHVPLDKRRLEEAHRDAGMDVMSCEYLVFLHLGVVNTEASNTKTASASDGASAKETIAAFLRFVEPVLDALPANGTTSPYIVCRATKPAAPSFSNRNASRTTRGGA